MKLSYILLCVGHYLASKIIYGCCVSIYLSIYLLFYNIDLFVCFSHTFTLYDICINVCLDSNTLKKNTERKKHCFVLFCRRACYIFLSTIHSSIYKFERFHVYPFVYYNQRCFFFLDINPKCHHLCRMMYFWILKNLKPC